MHTGSGLRVSKWWQNYIFWVNYRFNNQAEGQEITVSQQMKYFSIFFFLLCDALRDGLFLLDVCMPPDMPELEVLVHDLYDWDRSDNTLSNTYTGIVKILKAFLWNLQPSLSGTDHPQITVDIFEKIERAYLQNHPSCDFNLNTRRSWWTRPCDQRKHKTSSWPCKHPVLFEWNEKRQSRPTTPEIPPNSLERGNCWFWDDHMSSAAQPGTWT